MISVAFVNSYHDDLLLTDPYRVYEKVSDTLMGEVNDVIEKYNKSFESYAVEATVMGFSEENETMFVEASENFFETIGKKIMAATKAILDLLRSCLDKIKSIGFKNKSNMEKIDALMKKHPEMKDQIIGHAEDFSFNDLRSLKDMEAEFDEICRMSELSKIDPKSFRGKVEAFKKKVKNLDKSTVVVGVGTVVSLATAIFTLKKRVKESPDDTNKAIEATQRSHQRINQSIKNIEQWNKSHPNDKIDDASSRIQLLYQCHQAANNHIAALTRENQTKLDRLMNSVVSVAGKFENKVNPKALDATKADLKFSQIRQKSLDDETLAREGKKTFNNETAKLSAQTKYQKQHPKKQTDSNNNNSYNGKPYNGNPRRKRKK